MANSHSKPWQALAARAMVHLGTARLLLDLAIDTAPPEPLAGKLRSVEGEVTAAQDLVRSVAEVAS